MEEKLREPDAQCARDGEEQEAAALLTGMIAQGRASETFAPLSWYTYHRVTV